MYRPSQSSMTTDLQSSLNSIDNLKQAAWIEYSDPVGVHEVGHESPTKFKSTHASAGFPNVGIA